MMDRNVLVANPGFRRSWPSISLPFSLVATEHMAPFHIRTRDPASKLLMLLIQEKMDRVWFSASLRSAMLGAVSPTCSIRPGRGAMNMAEFSKLEWKCAAATYSAEFSQFIEKATSVDE